MAGGELTFHAKLRDEASRGFRAMRGELGSLRGVVNDLGRASALVSVAGGAAFVAFVKESIGAAVEARRVTVDLENAINRTGRAYQEVSAEVEAYATARAQATTFDDDAVKGSLSALVKTTGDYATALRLSTAAQDLATGRNIDLEQASQLLGRAYQGNIQRLGVYVPGLAQADSAAFRAMASHERLAIVVNEVEEAFGGAADSMDPVVKGLGDIRKNLGEVFEAFGTAIIDAESFQGAITTVNDALTELKTWLEGNKTAISEAFIDVLGAAIPIVQLMMVAVKGLIESLQTAVKMQGFFKLLMAPFGSEEAIKAYDQMAEGMGQLDPQIERTEKLFGQFASMLDKVREGLTKTRAAAGGGGAMTFPPLDTGKGRGPRAPRRGPAAAAGPERSMDFSEMAEVEKAGDAIFELRRQLVGVSEAFAESAPAAGQFQAEVAALQQHITELSKAQAAGFWGDEQQEKMAALREAIRGLGGEWEAYAQSVSVAQEEARASSEALGNFLKGGLAPAIQQTFSLAAGAMADLAAGSEDVGKALLSNFLRAIGGIALNLGTMLILSALGLAAIPGLQINAGTAGGIGAALVALGIGLSAGAGALAPSKGSGARGGAGGGATTTAIDEGPYRVGRPGAGAGEPVTIVVNAHFAGQPVITKAEVGRAVYESVEAARREGMVPRDYGR